MKTNLRQRIARLAILLLAATTLNAAPAGGPLRIYPTNPRYFTDGTTNGDDSLFTRLRGRALDLQNRGIYVSVMLFELYGFLDGEEEAGGQRLWEGNLFNRANNINGVDVDRNQNRLGEEFFSPEDPELLKLQKAYVEKMVDTLNDLDNVLWEICNEAPSAGLEWQCEMLRHLNAYQTR